MAKIIFFFLIIFFQTTFAYAYIDPFTGAFILKAIAALFLQHVCIMFATRCELSADGPGNSKCLILHWFYKGLSPFLVRWSARANSLQTGC